MDAKRIGRELRWLRQTLGGSQEDMADAARVTQATYSRWENGHSVPGLFEIQHMADATGIGLGTFLRLMGVSIEDATL